MNNIWSKTILQVYRYLPRIVGTYDKLILSKAVNSQFISGANVTYFSTEAVTDAILNLSQRKITLINLKLITEKALKSMKPSLARFLILKFIDGKKSVELADKFNVCLRTVFRKLNSALDSFSKALKRLGYDDDKLNTMLKKETWIKKVYENTLHKDFSLIENDDIKRTIKSSVIIDLRAVSVN